MTAAGIALAFAAAIANALAVVLQAAEARRSSASQAGRFSLLIALARRPRWLMGTGLLVLAWPLQVAALAFAPITAVQPILATTALALLVIARFKLREQITPGETLGVLTIVAGVVGILLVAPRHSVLHPDPARVAMPLAIVGAATLACYLFARRGRGNVGLSLVIGAGFGYAWSDFANKLLSNALSSGRLALAAAWLLAAVGFGGLAFVQEQSALQRRSAVTVAPVIGAVQDPLPVVMALWAGVERWSSSPGKILALAVGLALVAAGAAILGRSGAVARLSGQAAGSERRLRELDAQAAPNPNRPLI